MEFRILGPVEVVDGSRSLPLGGIRQRALLTALILRANEVVAVDELLDQVWGDDPPASGTRLVQVYVSQLRKLLGEGVILTRPPGYVLEAAPDAFDFRRFQRLVARANGADPETAAAALREGLALWRGPPLADFTYDSFAQIEIARLQESRLAALEARIEADLALGRHADLVAELEATVVEHPLRERLRAQLMLALYRSGRQAEALEAYQQARRILVEELGIEPGRALRELEQAILKQDSELEPEARPHAQEAHPAASPQEPQVRDARKTVSAVFVGLVVSSTQGEDLDPEALRGLTRLVFAEAETAAERHGGKIETVSGEAITLVFGLPTVHEDDALRAVRAAGEIRDRLADLKKELESERPIRIEARIGISTGEVVTGSAAGGQLSATGEPLTMSSRLGQASQPGEILLDQSTQRLVRGAVVVEPTDAAFRFVRVADDATGRVSRLVSPMVGRERERRRLHDSFDQSVSDRSCQLFTVLGPAGVGKSRLVQELLGDLSGQALVARGRCLPYGEGITFWPLREAVTDAVGLNDTDSPEQGFEKLVQALAEEQGAELLAQRVAEMIGLAEGAAALEEGFGAVRALFEACARRNPLVILFDDIHWGEATFLDLVEHLADWTRNAAILLICLSRSELLDVRPGWGGGKLNATSALLEPLSEAECAQLIQNLVGHAGLAEEVGTRIAASTEGNPLFVEEMLSMLIDDGLLVRKSGRWTAVGDIGTVRVPPTIHALLAARLDRLGEDERAVIECAAVCGNVFYEGAIAELAPEALCPAVADSLRALVRKELIRPQQASLGQRTYRFRHLLIRDAAYDSIPKGARGKLHERFGRWLERAAGDRATEYEEVVGYHLEQAYRYRVEIGPGGDPRAIGREAAERLGNAGRRAFMRSDAPAGLNLISRAVALLPPDDPLRVDLVPNVRVVQGLGDMTWADRVLTEAVEAAATTGDRRLAAHALVQRGLLRLFTEPEVTPAELIHNAERSLAVFEELGDELGQARAWRLTAQAHYLARRAGMCADASERALEHIRLTGDRFEEREIVEWLSIALFLGPAPAAEAAQRCDRLLEETAGQPLVQAMILIGQALLVAMQGRVDGAHELRARGRTIMNEHGEWIWIASFWSAFMSLWEDDPVAAERELRPGYEVLKKLASKSHLSSFAHLLAHAVYAQGRYDEAEQLIRECEEVARPNDVHSQILWRSMRAKVLARRGLLKEAEQLAREAVDFASKSDFYPAHADALMDLAEVLGLAGDTEGAANAVQEALHFYGLKGNVFAAGRARSQLAAYV
jgi:DNA-binding SARP family transcriptional activator